MALSSHASIWLIGREFKSRCLKDNFLIGLKLLHISGEKGHRFVNNQNLDFSQGNANGNDVSGQSLGLDGGGQSGLTNPDQTLSKNVTVNVAGPGIIVSWIIKLSLNKSYGSFQFISSGMFLQILFTFYIRANEILTHDITNLSDQGHHNSVPLTLQLEKKLTMSYF